MLAFMELYDDINFDCFARFYDADYREYTDDLQLIADLAQESPGPLLELGCGTGRVLLPMAAAGHAVTGVDNNEALLSIARRKLTESTLAGQVRLVQDDLRSFALPEHEFSMAYCVSNTLMHLTSQADQLSCLANAFRHLRSGGVLLIDLFNPDLPRLFQIAGAQELADAWIDGETGARVLKWSVRELDLGNQLQYTTFIYEETWQDGRSRRTVCPFVLRFLWPSEAQLMLQLTGFDVEAVWGDFDGNPYASDSERLLLLARKP
jgi:SAM-dependent methyltransferase